MKDDLDRLIDEIEAERPGFRAKVEAALARRLKAGAARDDDQCSRCSLTRRYHREHPDRTCGKWSAGPARGLSVRDAAALLGVTPAGLKLHDARLQPARDSSGRRTYDRAAVLALRDARAGRPGARSRRRRAS